eukprot:CAMPEP_0179044978 /NCGR_PEP_ID=MMETSP0796-20121207/17944_1 /TAXON_ID=73915 /ORGANISM="Pyrodinium bahamense, Strain pbaha01" /LENGTH=965 /DNA_ID=CAMNT_0020741377 /DNA_START=72 /DNA_END=2969 /DNA_ORIENTATION=-
MTAQVIVGQPLGATRSACSRRPLRCALLGLVSLASLAALLAILETGAPAFVGALGQLPATARTPQLGQGVERGAPPAFAAAPTHARSLPRWFQARGSVGVPPGVALLALGAAAALALQNSTRSESLVTMFGKHDPRTFRGKLHGHKFGKYRMRKTKARRLRAIRQGTFDPAKVVQRGQPEPEHSWDAPNLLANPLYTGNLPQWFRDIYDAAYEAQRDAIREDWEKRMGKYGKQYFFKGWTPPGAEVPPTEEPQGPPPSPKGPPEPSAPETKDEEAPEEPEPSAPETKVAEAPEEPEPPAPETKVEEAPEEPEPPVLETKVEEAPEELEPPAPETKVEERPQDPEPAAPEGKADRAPVEPVVPAPDSKAEEPPEKQEPTQEAKTEEPPEELEAPAPETKAKEPPEEPEPPATEPKAEEPPEDEPSPPEADDGDEPPKGPAPAPQGPPPSAPEAAVEEPSAEPPAAREAVADASATGPTPEAEGKKPKVAAAVVGAISASAVKELRERSRAGILDCKKALNENDGDMEKAMDWLRKKGIAKADKKAGNIAVEGNIASYVHFNSKIAVMVEVNSETDFVASNEIFKEFANDVAMQIAANPTVTCITADDVPAEVKEKEKELEMSKEDLAGKPDNIKEKIVEGRLRKKFEEMALMGQKWLKDEDKTVEEVLKERIAKLGENIVIRRFVRLNLGEGLEKKDTDFAAGVEKELAKYRSSPEQAAEAEKPKEEEKSKEEEKPKAEEKPKEEGPAITAAQVKELRERSGAGILDSKKALKESGGNIEKAMEWLKKKGMAKADKKAGNLSVEGAIASYVHFNSKLGVIVEVNSETDFVAMNSIFKEFAGDVAMQIAANPTVVCISADEVPEEIKAKEKEIEMSKEDLANKPDNIKDKIVEGRLKKKYEEMTLMAQKWLKDEEKTVQDILKERIAKLGENIVIRRFERLVLGEGLEKKDDDFAAGVEKELAKYRS